jgi:Zn finger protein HypA/HybF involved in hydrogenase expression
MNSDYQALLSTTSFINAVCNEHDRLSVDDGKELSQREKFAKAVINNFYETIVHCLVKPTDSGDVYTNGNGITDDHRSTLTSSSPQEEFKFNIAQQASKCWEILHMYAKTREDNVAFDLSQNCANEGLMMFFDLLEDCKSILSLFTHRYSSRIKCVEDACLHIHTTKDECTINDITSFDKNKRDLETVIKTLPTEIIEGFACPKCGSKTPKIKTTQLVMIPEIMIVLIKRYTFDNVGNSVQKTGTDVSFPEDLSFEGVEKNLDYKAVAVINHIGGGSGGHYYAHCKRRENKWYTFNDTQISELTGFPTTLPNASMVFYHLQADKPEPESKSE